MAVMLDDRFTFTKRDHFDNPILVSISGYEKGTGNPVDIQTVLENKIKASLPADAPAMAGALMDRWHNYGIAYTGEWDEKEFTKQFDDWCDDLSYEIKALWRRYKYIVEAYKTKVDWASGIINTTTYQDVKDTSDTHGDSTDWALPNKKVDGPYGTPTSHNENKGYNTNIKTGAVETKGMLNPVTQRDLYARLIRDAFGEMAEECAPLFNQMHL